MGGSPPEKPPPPPSGPKVAAWGLAIFVGTRIAAILLSETAMAAAVAQAVIAEWGVGRLGVTWSDPALDPPPTAARIAGRAGIGAAAGAVVASVVVGFLVATHAVLISRADPAASVVAMSIITAGLVAMRDELLLHGVTLRAIGDGSPAVLRVAACGITSAAAALGNGMPARGALASGLFGIVLGALWIRDKGAWLAWGANMAWMITTDLFFHGGLFDAHVAMSAWGGAEAGPLAGSAAVVSLLPFAAGAIVWAARR